MTLYDKIVALYPELISQDFSRRDGTIFLSNEGQGDYIKEWNHPTLARPTAEQLA